MLDQEYDPDAAVEIQARGQGFRFLVTPRHRHHYEELEHEPMTQCLLSRLVRRASIFVDVGASYGFFTLLAASNNPRIRVIACEPIPETASILARNIDRHQLSERVALRQCAVSASTGLATIFRSLCSDNCSFCPHPNAPPIGTELVRTETIDNLLVDCEPGPLLIKIDTDGHELQILEGMTETLRRFPDIGMVVEFNPKMIQAAGREPRELLVALDELGLATFLLDDQRHRYVRAASETDMAQLIDWAGYANLYCRPKALALSLAVFSHSAHAHGAERSLLELARELIDDHWSLVTAVCPGSGPFADQAVSLGAAVILGSYSWWCGRESPEGYFDGRFRRDLEAVSAHLVPELRTIDPDVVWSQTLTSPWGAVSALQLHRPHVWSVCEYGDPEHGIFLQLARDELLSVIEQWSQFVFCANPSMVRELFPALTEDRADHLYRHIPMPLTPDLAVGLACWRIHEGARLALLGSMVAAKGQEDAIRAVRHLVDDGHAVELVMAGVDSDPTQRQAIEQLIEELGLREHVRYLGYLADPYPTLAAADVVLICSRNEAFGRVAVEAMLLGRAVVYARSGGLADYMIDGETGLAYEPGDHCGLAERIGELMLDENGRERLGRRAREHARHLFSADAYGGKVYRRLMRLKQHGCPGGISRGLPQALAATLATISELQSGIEQRDVSLVAMRAELRDLEAARQDAAARLESSFKEAEQAKSALAEITRVAMTERKTEAEVEALRAELEVATARVGAMAASASWRITAPARAICERMPAAARGARFLMRVLSRSAGRKRRKARSTQ
jgi:FkbM family methyltransferase